MEPNLTSLYFPEGLSDYFELDYYSEFCVLSSKEKGILLHLTERNILPEGYRDEDYKSKGFVDRVIVQDFPIRGKMVFLSIRCRRWQHKQSHKIIRRDFDFLADGIRMTTELVAFLKGADRDPRRYDLEYM